MIRFLMAVTALFAGLLSEPPAQAGINSVGNGGGFAEMLTLMIDNTLSRHLSNCLSQPALCKLSETDRPFATRLLRELSTLQQTPLRFTPTCLDPAIRIGTGVIEISSCALYEDTTAANPVARKISELSEIAIAARILQMGAAVSPSLTQIFSGLTTTEDVFSVTLGTGRADMHVVRFAANYYQRTTSLVLESPRGAVDLTEKLNELLCPRSEANGEVKSWEAFFDNNSAVGSERVVFDGRIIWSCAMGSFQAKIGVAAAINQDSEVDQSTLVIRIRQKEMK